MSKRDETTVSFSAGGKTTGPIPLSEFNRRVDQITRGGAVGAAATEERQVVFDFATAQRKARQIQESRALLKKEIEKLGDAEEVLAGTAQARAVDSLTEEIANKKKELLDDEDLQELVARRKAAVKKMKSTDAGQKVEEIKSGVKALDEGIGRAMRELTDGVSNAAK